MRLLPDLTQSKELMKNEHDAISEDNDKEIRVL